MNYTKSGEQYQVPMDELGNFVIAKIEQYERVKNTLGEAPDENPYVDQLIYTMADGKAVAVPKEIQDLAISEYKRMQTVEEPEQTEQNETVNDKLTIKDWILYITVILCIILLGYIVYKQI